MQYINKEELEKIIKVIGIEDILNNSIKVIYDNFKIEKYSELENDNMVLYKVFNYTYILDVNDLELKNEIFICIDFRDRMLNFRVWHGLSKGKCYIELMSSNNIDDIVKYIKNSGRIYRELGD